MVILLWLAAYGVSPVSAGEDPPEYSLYFPLISNRYHSGMVYVPAGPFLMGCDPEHNGGFACEANELPLHEVVLEAYFIDKYEVTNAQYKECVAQGICQTIYMDPLYDNTAYANHPVRVNIERAIQYCQWAGKRLPSEEEWEKAARGPQPRAYPWGDQPPTCDLSNYAPDPLTEQYCIGDTTEGGSFPAGASLYGVLDMAGNVAEWTSSRSLGYGTLSTNSPTAFSVRGGSWYFGLGHLRTASRDSGRSFISSFGYRCVISEP